MFGVATSTVAFQAIAEVLLEGGTGRIRTAVAAPGFLSQTGEARDMTRFQLSRAVGINLVGINLGKSLDYVVLYPRREKARADLSSEQCSPWGPNGTFFGKRNVLCCECFCTT